MNLTPPFDTFRVEKLAGEYKEFANDGSYPLKGVTYPVDYGDIEGYLGEDGARLDVFVGSGSLLGFFKVYRPELSDGEHKFYINLTEDEESKVLQEFQPVILESSRFETREELLAAIAPFRQPTK